MKINDLLNELSQDIADSYDAIEAAGGTVPVDKTTSSLSSLTKIENNCLMGANNMTGTIDFGDLSPDNMTMPLYRQNCWTTTDSTAPIYTVGLTYTGRYARRWQDLFPSMSTPRYRKVWVS